MVKKTAVVCVRLLIKNNSAIKQRDKRYGDTEVRSGKFVTSVTMEIFVLGGGAENATN